MMRLLKAELQKLFTARATYYLLGFSLFMLFIFAFYAEGYHLSTNVVDRGKLAGEVTSAVVATALFVALVGALLVTNEYRHNTIMYTLTSSNSRLKILIAKIVAVTLFALFATLIIGALSPLLTILGVSLKGLDMVPQSIPYVDLLWKSAFFGWAYSMLAVLLAFIIRNQVGAIAALLLIPSAVEGLLAMVLKDKVNYLPFTALNTLFNSAPGSGGSNVLSLSETVLVVAGWIAGLLVVAVVLFKRRDAN